MSVPMEDRSPPHPHPSPTPPETKASALARPWRRFVQAHLFDYPTPARLCWLAILGSGLAAGGWALSLVTADTDVLRWALFAVLAAAAASSLPVRIPRTKFSLSTADICVYSALALLGPGAAVLAAGADGAIGAWRTSRRLTSRIATPAAAMAATAAAAWVHSQALAGFTGVLGPAGAALGALGVAALVCFVGATLPLTSMMALKRGQPVSLRDWFDACAWVGAMMLMAALAAGLIVLNLRLVGPGLMLAVGALVAISVVLLRVTFARQEADQAAQEAQLAVARREADMNQQRFMAAFSHAAVGMAIVAADGRTLRANRALAQLLGRDEAALVGQAFQRHLHPDDVPLLERLRHDLGDRPDETFSVQLRCQRPDGDLLWVTLHCSHFQDPGAEGRCVIYQLHDVTSRHLAEQRLHHIAYHDSLTDLANRACFTEHLAVAMARSNAAGAQHHAVLYLDLDRFKVVNDSLGHQAGNELLCCVADRLRECVRTRDLVARLGGDEFAVLCDGLEHPDQALQMAMRIIDSLARPLSIRGTEVVPGVSIGITCSGIGPRSVEEMLRDADLAMYEAKTSGRGRVAVFDVSMHARIADRLALEADLRHAIGEGRLSAAFQPIFALTDRRLAAVEALARWEHPTRGPIPPGVFIKLAEDAGHIESVTRWIIDHAVGQLAEWRHAYPGHESLIVNVNISGRDLADPGLVSHVHATLTKHQLPASRLTLEITETMLMSRLDTALSTLGALRELGVRFSIDDFGTGYSSLAYLSTLPFDSLKIDRSFVQGMASGANDIEIVRTVLKLGHTLGKVVVAEGIETAEQLVQLQRLGVDHGQGYLLSRPLSASGVSDLLRTLRPQTARASAAA